MKIKEEIILKMEAQKFERHLQLAYIKGWRIADSADSDEYLSLRTVSREYVKDIRGEIFLFKNKELHAKVKKNETFEVSRKNFEHFIENAFIDGFLNTGKHTWSTLKQHSKEYSEKIIKKYF